MTAETKITGPLNVIAHAERAAKYAHGAFGSIPEAQETKSRMFHQPFPNCRQKFTWHSIFRWKLSGSKRDHTGKFIFIEQITVIQMAVPERAVGEAAN